MSKYHTTYTPPYEFIIAYILFSFEVNKIELGRFVGVINGYLSLYNWINFILFFIHFIRQIGTSFNSTQLKNNKIWNKAQNKCSHGEKLSYINISQHQHYYNNAYRQK